MDKRSTKVTKTYDVVIIGAGLAGLQCARLLGARGFSVLLVDRKKDLTAGVHTTGIFVRKTFEDFDFPSGCLGKPISDVTLYSPRLKTLDLCSEKAEFQVGKMGLLYKDLLQQCVDAGVEFANKTRYLGCSPGPGGSTVGIEKDGRKIEVKTKVLIGADGVNSRVARDLKLDENKEWIVGFEEVYHAEQSTRTSRLHCFLDADLAPGYLAWIADDGEEIHIGVGGYSASFDPRKALKLFKEKVATKFQDLAAAEPAETRGGRIPVGGILRKIANEKGLLIGDAAGAVSPLTAGGLDPCMRLSTYAAEIIEKRLRMDSSSVLLEYSGEQFRSRFVSRLWMRRIISLFTNQTCLELVCFFLRRAIGQKLAKHIFFGRGSFPDLKARKEQILFGRTGY